MIVKLCGDVVPNEKCLNSKFYFLIVFFFSFPATLFLQDYNQGLVKYMLHTFRKHVKKPCTF